MLGSFLTLLGAGATAGERCPLRSMSFSDAWYLEHQKGHRGSGKLSCTVFMQHQTIAATEPALSAVR